MGKSAIKKAGSQCVQCGKKIVLTNETKSLWPFCSKRCKMIDLGKWLGGKYVVQDEATESTPNVINKYEQDDE